MENQNFLPRITSFFLPSWTLAMFKQIILEFLIWSKSELSKLLLEFQ